MRIEQIKDDFPKMPSEMRRMVEQEVNKQMKTTSFKEKKNNRKQYRSMGKVAAIAVAATLGLGTTVYAGVRLYQMNMKSVGEYGVETGIEKNAKDEKNEAGIGEIAPVRFEIGYMPEGMTESEEGKFCYEDHMNLGGFSLALYEMDLGDDAFRVLDTHVLESEKIDLAGREGVYLKLQNLAEEKDVFDQKIYLSDTENHYVVEMFIGNDMTREEAFKVAENIKLIPVESETEAFQGYRWSDYLAMAEEDAEGDASDEMDLTADAAEMKNLHKVGEAFSASNTGNGEYAGLEVKVSEVEILDNVNGLGDFLEKCQGDEAAELLAQTDAQGNLLKNTVSYVKYGNGTDTLDEVVATVEAAQKLVYVTVEYTNNGSKELSDVMFFGSLMLLQQNGDQYSFYQGETLTGAPATGSYDDITNSSGIMSREMMLYDVQGGERSNNYIDSIQAGETKTVHMAYVINEGEESCLFLNLDTSGGAYEFTGSSLEMGLVDLRQ